ncbi:MAG TPA: sigma-54 dependent transcriptional regulator [Bryobacteraceae bacterium]|nr:sigma-54 dependent transcriptional regulator [Bryobacteraceae bacterium]
MEKTEPRLFLGMPAVIASDAMRELMRMVERVAITNASVLIQGESGSGKELVARAIHHCSLRCSKPWVDVSCAALPEHLIESELFGYEKGAFSGADSVKPGLFELAHQGTLFLDEIGELEPKMQVKLLRVLDGVPYYRLGGVRKTTVNVRVVAATNRNLQEAVGTGRFRNDLFHRLSQISLQVPPLRERGGDIVPIARYFLEQQNARARFSNGAMEALRRHAWPGNIRELRNVVLKAAILSDSDEICEENLPAEFRAAPHPPRAEPATSIDGMERRMIFDVLAQTGGHQQKAAAVLGISRRTLSRKLKLYNLGSGIPEEHLSRGAVQ